MKSNTVKFNMYSFFVVLSLVIASFVMNVDVPAPVFMIMTIFGWIISQAITYFHPSGEFVGHGQNWTTAKWISRVGSSVLAVLAMATGAGWGVAAIAVLTPVIEIIVRVYGTDTPEQRQAALSK